MAGTAGRSGRRTKANGAQGVGRKPRQASPE